MFKLILNICCFNPATFQTNRMIYEPPPHITSATMNYNVRMITV